MKIAEVRSRDDVVSAGFGLFVAGQPIFDRAEPLMQQRSFSRIAKYLQYSPR
jgi:hypothetical protein